MKRVMAIVAVLMMAFVLSSMAFAKEMKPDATIKLSEGQVGVGIGWSWGKGVLTFKGVDHSFKIKGLSVGDVGVTKADSVGTVYHLKKLSDFNGTYTSAAARGSHWWGCRRHDDEESKRSRNRSQIDNSGGQHQARC